MSYPLVMQLLIHMIQASLILCISLDQYLNPNLYTTPNMQNMRFFCCSVYVKQQHVHMSKLHKTAKTIRRKLHG